MGISNLSQILFFQLMNYLKICLYGRKFYRIGLMDYRYQQLVFLNPFLFVFWITYYVYQPKTCNHYDSLLFYSLLAEDSNCLSQAQNLIIVRCSHKSIFSLLLWQPLTLASLFPIPSASLIFQYCMYQSQASFFFVANFQYGPEKYSSLKTYLFFSLLTFGVIFQKTKGFENYAHLIMNEAVLGDGIVFCTLIW